MGQENFSICLKQSSTPVPNVENDSSLIASIAMSLAVVTRGIKEVCDNAPSKMLDSVLYHLA